MNQSHPPPNAAHRGGFFLPIDFSEVLSLSHPIVSDIASRLDANLREAWEERAAVMEFDAGIQRDLAEALALLLVFRQYPRQALAALS